MASQQFDFYEVESTVIHFKGAMGSRGVLVYRPDDRWEYHSYGSILWDSLHQQVYRNHKGEALTEKDLNCRGIRLPRAEEYQYQTKGMDWKDNFESSISFAEVPGKLLSKLKRHPRDPKSVYLVLYEDCYETSFGDGRFLYPAAAFWTESDALDEITNRQNNETDSARNEFYRYYVKEITVSVDESKKHIAADLNIEVYEHYSLNDIIRLLADTSPKQNKGAG
ncbi:MAG: hypothetical protein AB9903_18495 [Vulcanimicrobiota bacterium]